MWEGKSQPLDLLNNLTFPSSFPHSTENFSCLICTAILNSFTNFNLNNSKVMTGHILFIIISGLRGVATIAYFKFHFSLTC